MITALPPIPGPDVAVVDPRTGKMTREWYVFVRAMWDRVGKLVVFGGTGSTVVASLPSAASVGAGARAFVTDATSSTFGSTVAGGGSTKVPVVSNGTAWVIG